MAFTTVQYLKLVQVAVVAAQTTQYTVPASRQDVIKSFEVCNTTAGSLTFTMNLVPNGGTAGTGNQILSAVTIPGNQTLHWTGTQVMNAGDFISTAASSTTCARACRTACRSR